MPSTAPASRRTLNDFLFETLVVALGVLLALALQQWLDNRRDHQRWVEAQAAIRTTLSSSRDELRGIADWIESQREKNRRLLDLLALADPSAAEAEAYRTLAGTVDSLLLIERYDAWNSAVFTGALRTAPAQQLEMYANAIQIAEEVQRSLSRTLLAQASAFAVLSSSPLPGMDPRERLEAKRSLRALDYEFNLLKPLLDAALTILDEALALPAAS